MENTTNSNVIDLAQYREKKLLQQEEQLPDIPLFDLSMDVESFAEELRLDLNLDNTPEDMEFLRLAARMFVFFTHDDDEYRDLSDIVDYLPRRFDPDLEE